MPPSPIINRNNDFLGVFLMEADYGFQSLRRNKGMVGKANEDTGIKTVERGKAGPHGVGHFAFRIAVSRDVYGEPLHGICYFHALRTGNDDDIPNACLHDRVETTDDRGFSAEWEERLRSSHPRG